jgi:glycosyltransferase involved in cell wall biosynthesis
MTGSSKLDTISTEQEAATPAQHPSWNAYPVSVTLPPVIINDPELPLVSIVTPSYNQGPFIRETIESVLSQDYPNLEYWVIDGGSTDSTLDILREHDHDPRFHWLSEPDKGQADAVNKGWVRCRGEILGWLNSDDTYLPGAVAAQVQPLCDHPQVGLVYGDAVYIDQYGNMVSPVGTRPFSRERAVRATLFAQPTAFLRRELVEHGGLLNINFTYALDLELFMRLMWHTDYLYNRRLIATYRLHSISKTTGQYRGMVNECLLLVRHICEQHADTLGHIKTKAIADRLWAGASLSLKTNNYHDVLVYALLAMSTHPFRPRTLVVMLKLLDQLCHTRLAEWAMQFERQRSWQSHTG